MNAIFILPLALTLGNASAANVLINGDFESNNLANGQVSPTTIPISWSVTSGDVDIVNNALAVVGTNGPTWVEIGGLTGIGNTVIEQAFTPTIPGLFSVGLDYTSWSLGGQFPINISLIDSLTTLPLIAETVTPSEGNGVWQQFRTTATLVAGQSYVFRLYDSGSTGNGDQGAVFDNAFVSKVPEPSSALLGGVTSLLLLKRRR